MLFGSFQALRKAGRLWLRTTPSSPYRPMLPHSDPISASTPSSIQRVLFPVRRRQRGGPYFGHGAPPEIHPPGNGHPYWAISTIGVHWSAPPDCGKVQRNAVAHGPGSPAGAGASHRLGIISPPTASPRGTKGARRPVQPTHDSSDVCPLHVWGSNR